MVMERVAFRTAMRAAAVDMLRDYAADSNTDVNVLPARPTKQPALLPFAFADGITETITDRGNVPWQRIPTLEVVVLHRLWDGVGAADQADRFSDGFLEWVAANVHKAGPLTLVRVARIDDDPTYTLDWLEEPRTYYATRIELEGYVEG